MSTQTSLIVVESDHRVSSETRDEEEEECRGGESIYADRLDARRRQGGLTEGRRTAARGGMKDTAVRRKMKREQREARQRRIKTLNFRELTPNLSPVWDFYSDSVLLPLH